MDPLGTAAQAGGTVCWKGQEQGCQYQGTANRLFYKLALISEVGGRAAGSHAVRFHTPALPRRAGSISGKQSLLLLSHTLKPSMSSWSKGAASPGLQLWDFLMLLCSLARGVMQATRPPTARLHRLSRPPSWLKMPLCSYSPQSSCCIHHLWREALGSPPGLTVTLSHSTDSLPQPSPLCSVHIHSR